MQQKTGYGFHLQKPTRPHHIIERTKSGGRSMLDDIKTVEENMDKEPWTEPSVEDLDIALMTQGAFSGTGADLAIYS